jgi:hypothetical protein
MTLKEKFEKVNNTLWLRNESELAKIAEEFAIGFAEWICDAENAKELLEIYKKEKGL